MTLGVGQVRMPVHDDVAPLEPRDEPLCPPGSSAGVVDDADPRARGLDNPRLGKQRSQRGVVDVAVHGLHRRERPQLLEHAQRHEVARVDDQIGRLELAQARVREPPRPARQMRVGENRDARRY